MLENINKIEVYTDSSFELCKLKWNSKGKPYQKRCPENVFGLRKRGESLPNIKINS